MKIHNYKPTKEDLMKLQKDEASVHCFQFGTKTQWWIVPGKNDK